jgi:hypothetical protein
MSTESYPAILTKENFWNELQKKYPVEMKKFCDWVDEYKKRVEWETLFAVHVRGYKDYKGATPKFHEIPVAMQIGIFFQFTTEMSESDQGVHLFNIGEGHAPTSMSSYIERVHRWFAVTNKIYAKD